ncbi:hypothetical protein PN462_05305 [Spirulina sp. CS-785/01]|uniref:class I SAM-dependent methyltransferase n=1 Tax=Spirulina sp. CS-785/01 TaxID=3021716 RepID=UPI00232EFDEC|nr:hypothetical protein [Spirulina sp. CS-785/01]MDB9312514.1 hypothetical protein [Spirulina sp. CS-785/01]
MSNLRLNLGCGLRHLEGYLNVDKFGNPDLKLDLETFPWPWDDNSVSEIKLIHVLEHLGEQTETYFKIFQEMYRICHPQASIHIIVPHHRHDDFVHDPTHVRAITPNGLNLFSQKLNQQWQTQGCANSPLGLYLDIDFELTKTSLVPSEVWYERYPNQKQNLQLLLQESALYNNLIKEVEMVLVVIK